MIRARVNPDNYKVREVSRTPDKAKTLLRGETSTHHLAWRTMEMCRTFPICIPVNDQGETGAMAIPERTKATEWTIMGGRNAAYNVSQKNISN
jgi:hypothetical protein